MRKLIAFFFLFQMLVVSLLPKMAVGELHKSASLIQHLQQHIDSGDSEDFLEAFANHYSFRCDHKDPGHAEELPFLSFVQQGLSFVVQLPVDLPEPAITLIKANHPMIVQLFKGISLEVMVEPPAIMEV
jgi:hypothetical protein